MKQPQWWCIMIDLTRRGMNEAAAVVVPDRTTPQARSTNELKRPRRSERSKPTQPVGIDRWNPGIY
jgi:hypothetical protein